MEIVIDVVLAALAVLAIFVGWRRGALMSASSLIGLVVGFWLGVIIAPPAVSSISAFGIVAPDARIGLAVAVVLVCVIVVHALVTLAASRVHAHVGVGVFRGVDSAGGALFGLLTWAAIVWLLAGFVQTTGVVEATQMVASSRVVAELDSISPVPVDNALGALDNVLGNAGLPQVFADGAEVIAGTQAPDSTIPAAVNAAAPSIVKVLGNEPLCDTNSEGSGWVISPDRVVTNAHVVAGATTISIQESGSGLSLAAHLVVYDPSRDVAILDVPNLTAHPLPLGTALGAGADAVVAGYPGDGAYTVVPARVRQVMQAEGTDIYKESNVTRQIYSLRAVVRPGNSGGPLFSDDGHVVGMVFARSTVDADTGYALTLDEMGPDLAKAANTTTVASGRCSSD